MSDIVKRLVAFERRMDRMNLPELGAQFTPLTEPYTNTDFDGDSFSDVAAHTIIQNTSWSTTIPTTAKALALQVYIADSGSAAQQYCYFELYSTATATNPALACYCGGLANDALTGNAGIVPCTAGDIWYRVNASGASTMDVWIRVTGYWT